MATAAQTIRETLVSLGYEGGLIDVQYLGEDGTTCTTGFAQAPKTKRNACVALVAGTADNSSALAAAAVQATGSAVVGVVSGNLVELFRATATGGATRAEGVENTTLQGLTALRLDPRTIHRAKTYGRFDKAYQLDLVDVGLLPNIETVQGEELQRLLERIVRELRQVGQAITDEEGHQVLTVAFWLLAARMLHDHGVEKFLELDPQDGRSVLEAVGAHYRGLVPLLAKSDAWRNRINAACDAAWRSGLRLSQVGPEAISHVYESSLIAKQTRADLGTHSTPSFLVEYIIGRLREHIRAIPPNERIVAEPACGHGAFLVAALRVLAEDPPSTEDRHSYLRARIRGIEVDEAAREMARLSLTIADVPNPDGWDLRSGDMFRDQAIENLARDATIFLTNPPFEDFSKAEKEALASANSSPVRASKVSELLRRALPALGERAVIGLVVPRTFLTSHKDRDTRAIIVRQYRILEICTFPDKVFQFSDQECAVILAVKDPAGTSSSCVTFRWIRDGDLEHFRRTAAVSAEELISGSNFLQSQDTQMYIPELRRLWNARRWVRLGEIADVGQGLVHHGWVETAHGKPLRANPFAGGQPGLDKFSASAELPVTGPPRYCFIDLDPTHVRRWCSGHPSGQPQVVANYHPRSRGSWRISAFIEEFGVAVPSNWNVIRPNEVTNWPVEVIWAIVNSMFTNSYINAHCGKRDIHATALRQLPLPYLDSVTRTALVEKVRSLKQLSSAAETSQSALATVLLQIEAIVISGYGLFAPMEQRLLEPFVPGERLGFPFATLVPPKDSRLPVCLSGEVGSCSIPQESVVGSFSDVTDADAEIEDAYAELAALRRLPRSQRSRRVEARMEFLRMAVHEIQTHAADRWIPLELHPAAALDEVLDGGGGRPR